MSIRSSEVNVAPENALVFEIIKKSAFMDKLAQLFIAIFFSVSSNCLINKPCPSNNEHSENRIIQFGVVVQKLCAYIHYDDSFMTNARDYHTITCRWN